MTDRVARVRIDRLVLRGVDLDPRDAGSLPTLVATAIEQRRRAPTGPAAQGGDARAIAAAIARRATAAVADLGKAP